MNSGDLGVEDNIPGKIQSLYRFSLNKDYTVEYREALTDIIRKLNPKPVPLGEKCNSGCPYFKCFKNALQLNKRVIRGVQTREATCLLLGGPCKGSECRHASCTIKALNANSKCLLALLSKRGL